MIPNRDQMNTTLPTNTGGGLGFIDKNPSPRPAPAELLSPSNASLMNGTSPGAGLGSTMGVPSMNTRMNPMPAQQMVSPPVQMGKTSNRKSWQGNVMRFGLFGVLAGAGWVLYSKFGSDDFEAEMERD